jgi:hypothetical protein
MKQFDSVLSKGDVLNFMIKTVLVLLISQFLIIAGGMEMGVTFRAMLVNLGVSFSYLNVIVSIALPIGLALNVIVVVRSHFLFR